MEGGHAENPLWSEKVEIITIHTALEAKEFVSLTETERIALKLLIFRITIIKIFVMIIRIFSVNITYSFFYPPRINNTK